MRGGAAFIVQALRWAQRLSLGFDRGVYYAGQGFRGENEARRGEARRGEAKAKARKNVFVDMKPGGWLDGFDGWMDGWIDAAVSIKDKSKQVVIGFRVVGLKHVVVLTLTRCYNLARSRSSTQNTLYIYTKQKLCIPRCF